MNRRSNTTGDQTIGENQAERRAGIKPPQTDDNHEFTGRNDKTFPLRRGDQPDQQCRNTHPVKQHRCSRHTAAEQRDRKKRNQPEGGR